MERVDYESIVVQELIELHERNEINLSPWYQRRSVWSRAQKAYLINSLFERKPVPTIYVRHYLDIESERSIREIVDGQQRIKSVLEYLDGAFAARHPEHRTRVTYSNLSKTQKSAFRMTKLSVGYLIDASDSDVIEIFGRLNSVSKTLNEQEKRNARFSGEMKQFCLRQAASRVALWRTLDVFSSNDVARMIEVQFMSDLIMNMALGLSDYSAKKLDSFYADNDDDFTQAVQIEARLERVFSLLAAIEPGAIKDTIFSRQPIFFSLCLTIDASDELPHKQQLTAALHAIDEMFNADIPINARSTSEADFINACTSSTQRIRSRETRNSYLKAALKL